MTYEATISFDQDMTEAEHKDVWRKVCRNLNGKGISGIWVREITKADRIHYHLLFVTPELDKGTIEVAVPKAYQDVCRVHFDRVHNQLAVAYYFTKAKIRGDGVSDKYRDKRRLFHKSLSNKCVGRRFSG